MTNASARLIMVMGLPGSGKTYFAKTLAKRMVAAHFNSDRIRKEATQHVQYTAEDKARIYDTMLERVTMTLAQGEAVIVDATFSKELYRKPYLQWAAANEVPVFILYMVADESVIAERVAKKRPDSDADFAVYEKIKAEYEPIIEAHKVLRSDDGSMSAWMEEALNYIEQEPPPQ